MDLPAAHGTRERGSTRRGVSTSACSKKSTGAHGAESHRRRFSWSCAGTREKSHRRLSPPRSSRQCRTCCLPPVPSGSGLRSRPCRHRCERRLAAAPTSRSRSPDGGRPRRLAVTYARAAAAGADRDRRPIARSTETPGERGAEQGRLKEQADAEGGPTACRSTSYSVVVDGTPAEVWKLFWYRGPRPPTNGVQIEILHPGDEIGEGLVSHCTFKVPKYLLTGGVGHSWEWLTQVKPYESWKYDAVGKPLGQKQRAGRGSRIWETAAPGSISARAITPSIRSCACSSSAGCTTSSRVTTTSSSRRPSTQA